MKADISKDRFDATKHYSGVVMQQGRVQLDSDWNEQLGIERHLEKTLTCDVVGLTGAPVHQPGFQIASPDGKSLTVGKGRFYAGGWLCENENTVDFRQQPDFPNAPDPVAAMTAAQTTTAIVYLDVWQRHVTGIDDPGILEPALGGADTTTRLKTTWQVRLLPVKPANAGQLSCGDTASEWDALIASPTGKLSARAQPVAPTDSPCLLPPGAGYRRLENQLYRIEVHKPGADGTATFKWSRDNGSVVTAIDKVNGLELTVHDLGRDAVLGFASGQWVEVLDDAIELSGQPGALVQIDRVDEAARLVVLKTAPPAVDPARHAKLRRWDSAADAVIATPAANGGFVALEEGVEVRFEAGTYRTGDYWLVPARTVTGNVEWPFATPQRPAGVAHAYARLAVLTLAGNALGTQDCRSLFAPIAEVPPALHITGLNWVNDDVMPQLQLQNNGLQITLDGALTPPAPAPQGASPAMMVVTAVTPLPLKSIVPTADPGITLPITTVLNGDVSFPSPNVILWRPAQNGAEMSNLFNFLIGQQVARVRFRVVLKGGALWNDPGNGPLRYLDGYAAGQPGFRADGSPRIDLQFPSGVARRSSDFESWFYVQLQLPVAALSGIVLSPVVVNAGGSVQGTITLDHPAPAAGFPVTLASSAPQAVVASPVTVPPGQVQAIFNFKTTAPASTLSVLLTASAGNVTKQATLTIQVVTVSIAPAEVTIFQGHGQQFSASVAGAADGTVTWTVQEPNGGSVNTSGLYIPSAVGDFHVVATSAADPSKRAVATVHVRAKPKDKEKEKEVEKLRTVEKINVEKLAAAERIAIGDVIRGAAGAPAVLRSVPAAAADAGAVAPGRAFIRSDLRPAVTPTRRTG
jgi:Family of unknown function (DUF6519)